MNVAQFFSFDGRLRRRDFWLSNIILWVIGWAAGSVGNAFFLPSLVAADADHASIAISPMLGGSVAVQGVVGLILLWPSLAIAVKRCHDRAKSGWWLLLLFVPVIGWLWWLIDLGILDGKPGSNRFGPSPKAELPPAAVAA